MKQLKIIKYFEPILEKYNINSSLLYKMIRIKQESIYQDMLGDNKKDN